MTLAWLIPAALWALAAVESRFSRKWSAVVRDWIPLSLILAGYWQADWFPSPPVTRWEQTWIQWDRILLDGFGLRRGLEAFGWMVPSLLEGAYLLLYAVPPLCVGALYLCHKRARTDRFLATCFLGTFFVYALLPHFPTASPRLMFPGQDLPNFGGLCRSMNVWLLDHLDISTSVFPSGHVAVAFSAALGLRQAVPEKRLLWGSFLAVAGLVFTATVYGRYHYAVDGLASVGIAALASRCSGVLVEHHG
ncbi:MAG: phosphatase PAP2 family protein [Acidobacteria bacterium]|nr:phosphatase PAP2 family protein [Acidobacteriota bacterium]